MMQGKLEGEDKKVVLITFSTKDIDRIYWRFLLNSVALSLAICISGSVIAIFIMAATMQREERAPAITPTSTIEPQSTPQASEPAPALSAEQMAVCVEKMQAGQIEAYNNCLKNR